MRRKDEGAVRRKVSEQAHREDYALSIKNEKDLSRLTGTYEEKKSAYINFSIWKHSENVVY